LRNQIPPPKNKYISIYILITGFVTKVKWRVPLVRSRFCFFFYMWASCYLLSKYMSSRIPWCDVSNDFRFKTMFGSSFVLCVCVFGLYMLFIFMNTDVQHYIRIRWCTCRLTVTQRVSPWVSEFMCSGMVGSSRTRCGTCRINLKNKKNSYHRGNQKP